MVLHLMVGMLKILKPKALDEEKGKWSLCDITTLVTVFSLVPLLVSYYRHQTLFCWHQIDRISAKKIFIVPTTIFGSKLDFFSVWKCSVFCNCGQLRLRALLNTTKSKSCCWWWCVGDMSHLVPSPPVIITTL